MSKVKRLIRGNTPRKMLNEQLVEISKKPFLASNDYLRASSIVNACPREEALCSRDSIVRERRFTAKQKRVFLFGTAFEKLVREQLDFYGHWQCDVCNWSSEGEPILKPHRCGKCGVTDLNYKEVFYLDEERFIGGHTDGFLKFNDELFVMELKTATTYFFNQYKEWPNDSHYGQIQCYMELSGIHKGLIWYFNKDTSEDLMWQIEYDKQTVDTLFEKGRQLRQYFISGLLPNRICPTVDCAKASQCSVGELCFRND